MPNSYFDKLSFPCIVCDMEGRVMATNERSNELFDKNIEGHQITAFLTFENDSDDATFQQLTAELLEKNVIHRIVDLGFSKPPIERIEVHFSFDSNTSPAWVTLQIFDSSDKHRSRRTNEYREILLDNVMKNSKEAVIVFDELGYIEFFSPAAESIFGRNSTEMMIEDIFFLFAPEHHKKIEESFNSIKDNKSSDKTLILQDVECINSDDQSFPISAVWSKSGNKNFPFFFLNITDITLLKTFINSVNDTYIRTTEDGAIFDINDKAQVMFDGTRDQFIGKTLKLLKLRPVDDSKIVDSPGKLINKHSKKSRDNEEDFHASTFNGDTIVVNITIWPQQSDDGKLYNIIIRDITQKKIAEQKLITSAYSDPLTALANRAYFMKVLNERVATYENSGRKMTLIALDLDKFKNINDTLGHDYGDALLCDVSERLKSCVRDNDVVCRMGGDEFTILLDNVPARSQIEYVCQRLLNEFNQDFRIKGKNLSVTSSIGIANFPIHATNSQDLIKAADIAMYEAKKAGKNRFEYYSNELDSKKKRRDLIERHLLQAIEKDELTLMYQPKFQGPDMLMSGMEALLRWTSPTLGVVSPAEFIPISEESGLVIELSRWVFRQSVRQFVQWQDTSTIAKKYLESISINVSTQHFKADLLSDLTCIIAEEKMDANALEIEITESALMENIDSSIAILKQISEVGVAISVDDFGTGYSSLQYLQKLPLDTIKIDRAFVDKIADNNHNLFIVEAIISIANRLNLGIVAEGVERQTDLNRLVSLNCHYFQGYHLSKPLMPDQILPFLSDNVASQGNAQLTHKR